MNLTFTLKQHLITFLTVSLFSVAATSYSQETLLFKLSHHETAAPSYLYGTMHLNDDTFNACEASIKTYLSQCSVFSGELDLTNVEPTPELAMSMMMLETSLASLYPEDDYQRVKAYMTEKLGAMAPNLEQLKPFWIMATIMQLSEGAMTNPDDVIDVRLQRMAEGKGLKIKPLETIKEQMAAIDAIGLKEQAKMLLESIDQEEDEMMDEIKRCYAKANLSCIESVYNENKFDEGTEGSLIIERNQTMVKRLTTMINKGETVFCAVGALHLPGEKGLIYLLEAAGYTVEPIFYLPCD